MKKIIVFIAMVLVTMTVFAGVVYYGPGKAVFLENIIEFANTLQIEATSSKKLKVDGELSAENVIAANVGINRISIGAFENTDDDFNSYVDAAGVLPVDGDGGGPSTYVTCSQTGTSPLEGNGSLQIYKFNTLSGGQGHGCSYDFNIGTDQAQMYEISFDYLWSDIAANEDGDFIVYIYDVDNGALIQPVGYEIYQNGLKNTHRATFQTDGTSDDYRLIFHVAQDRAGLYSMKVDNLYVGKQRPAPSAVPVSDWESYTPIIYDGSTDRSSEFSSIVFAYRRVGSTVQIKGYFGRNGTATSGTGGDITISLPSGITVDTSVISQNIFNKYINSNALGTYDKTMDIYSNKMRIIDRLTVATLAYNSTNMAINSRHSIVAEYEVIGWSSNQTASVDFGSRDIGASRTTITNTTIPAGVAYVPLDMSSDVSVDNSGGIEYVSGVGYNSTTGAWTTSPGWIIPETGKYLLGGYLHFDVSRGDTQLAVHVTGGYGHKVIARTVYATAARELDLTGITQINLPKGAKVTLGVYNQTGTATLEGAGNMFISKIQSPQQMLASEKVYGFANTTGAATGDLLDDTPKTIVWDNKVSDSHNILNTSTGELAIPKSGYLNLTASFSVDDTTDWSVNDLVGIYVYVGTTNIKRKFQEVFNTSASSIQFPIGINIVGYPVNKDDIVTIKAYQLSGATQTLRATSLENSIGWEIK